MEKNRNNMRKLVNSYHNTDYENKTGRNFVTNIVKVLTCYNINGILYNAKNFATFKFKLKSIKSGFVARR